MLNVRKLQTFLAIFEILTSIILNKTIFGNTKHFFRLYLKTLACEIMDISQKSNIQFARIKTGKTSKTWSLELVVSNLAIIWKKNRFSCLLALHTKYHIFANSFRGNYFFFLIWPYVLWPFYKKVRKLLKRGNYSRAETIRGNTAC